MNNWFTGDSHFSHKNIIKYSKRPFTTEEHDNCLINNWNNHVQQGDNVYFLGDFCFTSEEHATRLRNRLNGNIYFIEGNHDKTAFKIRHLFGWYKSTMMIRVGDQQIWLSHYAHRTWNKSHHGAWHLYGHSHNSLPDDPNSMSFDVGVDAVAAKLSGLATGQVYDIGMTKKEDYRPLSFDEVKAIMATKTWKPIDHHGAREHEVAHP
jgi:calcineurin-like phosphoesterase family protein